MFSAHSASGAEPTQSGRAVSEDGPYNKRRWSAKVFESRLWLNLKR